MDQMTKLMLLRREHMMRLFVLAIAASYIAVIAGAAEEIFRE